MGSRGGVGRGDGGDDRHKGGAATYDPSVTERTSHVSRVRATLSGDGGEERMQKVEEQTTQTSPTSKAANRKEGGGTWKGAGGLLTRHTSTFSAATSHFRRSESTTATTTSNTRPHRLVSSRSFFSGFGRSKSRRYDKDDDKNDDENDGDDPFSSDKDDMDSLSPEEQRRQILLQQQIERQRQREIERKRLEHVEECTLRILIVTANLGNAEPTKECIDALLPKDGVIDEVQVDEPPYPLPGADGHRRNVPYSAQIHDENKLGMDSSLRGFMKKQTSISFRLGGEASLRDLYEAKDSNDEDEEDEDKVETTTKPHFDIIAVAMQEATFHPTSFNASARGMTRGDEGPSGRGETALLSNNNQKTPSALELSRQEFRSMRLPNTKQDGPLRPLTLRRAKTDEPPQHSLPGPLPLLNEENVETRTNDAPIPTALDDSAMFDDDFLDELKMDLVRNAHSERSAEEKAEVQQPNDHTPPPSPPTSPLPLSSSPKLTPTPLRRRWKKMALEETETVVVPARGGCLRKAGACGVGGATFAVAPDATMNQSSHSNDSKNNTVSLSLASDAVMDSIDIPIEEEEEVDFGTPAPSEGSSIGRAVRGAVLAPVNVIARGIVQPVANVTASVDHTKRDERRQRARQRRARIHSLLGGGGGTRGALSRSTKNASPSPSTYRPSLAASALVEKEDSKLVDLTRRRYEERMLMSASSASEQSDHYHHHHHHHPHGSSEEHNFPAGNGGSLHIPPPLEILRPHHLTDIPRNVVGVIGSTTGVGSTEILHGHLLRRCPSYDCPVRYQLGEMRLVVMTRKGHGSSQVSDVQYRAVSTGIGGVLANKGGIVASITVQKTRLSFLAAHLEAHEGVSHYVNRNQNLADILDGARASGTTPDATLTSHYMFAFGDLNYRVSPSEEVVLGQENGSNMTAVDRRVWAMSRVKEEDWETLNEADEMKKALARGDCLAGFQTLPCHFPPTFKVTKGEQDFVYNKKRTPSFTDRILWKCADGLSQRLTPIVYEPVPSFTTSDHKPVRGAFTVVSNECVLPIVSATTPSTSQPASLRRLLLMTTGQESRKLSASSKGGEEVSTVGRSITSSNAFQSARRLMGVSTKDGGGGKQRLHIFISNICCSNLPKRGLQLNKPTTYVLFQTDPSHLLRQERGALLRFCQKFGFRSHYKQRDEDTGEWARWKKGWPRTRKVHNETNPEWQDDEIHLKIDPKKPRATTKSSASWGEERESIQDQSLDLTGTLLYMTVMDYEAAMDDMIGTVTLNLQHLAERGSLSSPQFNASTGGESRGGTGSGASGGGNSTRQMVAPNSSSMVATIAGSQEGMHSGPDVDGRGQLHSSLGLKCVSIEQPILRNGLVHGTLKCDVVAWWIEDSQILKRRVTFPRIARAAAAAQQATSKRGNKKWFRFRAATTTGDDAATTT